MTRRIIALLFMALLCTICVTACAKSKKKEVTPPVPQKVVLGIERLQEAEVQAQLGNKRLGIFTNQSGVDSQMTHSIDLVKQHNNLVSVFAPEHGVFGAVAAGETFDSTKYRDIPVHSLYGSVRRPTKEMLDEIDIMLVDIQDVGIRHYTYFSSLAYIMEECAKYDKKVIVFDRPNPLGAKMQGPVLKPQMKSFIGLYEIPLRHGLTIGEFAQLINETENIHCDLSVIPMLHYNPNMTWAQTGLPWVQTSPQIPTADTAFLYGVTGISGGGTSLSVGIGTAKPFATVGAPYADALQVKQELDTLQLSGVAFRAAVWSPKYGDHADELVQGVEIVLLNKENVNLPELDYLLVETFRKLYPDKFTLTPTKSAVWEGYNGYKVDLESGDTSYANAEPHETAFARWNDEVAAFQKKVKPYLLYQ